MILPSAFPCWTSKIEDARVLFQLTVPPIISYFPDLRSLSTDNPLPSAIIVVTRPKTRDSIDSCRVRYPNRYIHTHFLHNIKQWEITYNVLTLNITIQIEDYKSNEPYDVKCDRWIYMLDMFVENHVVCDMINKDKPFNILRYLIYEKILPKDTKSIWENTTKRNSNYST